MGSKIFKLEDHVPNWRKKLKWSVISFGVLFVILASPVLYFAYNYPIIGVKAYLLTPQGSCVDRDFDPVKSANPLTCTVELSGESAYQLSLAFAWPRNDKKERIRIGNLIAPNTRGSDGKLVGSPLHLQLTIKRENGEVFISKELISPVSHSGGNDFIYVELLLERFTKGEYLIEIKNMKATPELAGIPAKIKMWPFLSK